MALPTPFNSVPDLMAFTSFRQGPGGPRDEGSGLQEAATGGTFDIAQYRSALQRARNEIYSRCGRLANDGYDDWRLSQLTEAELWLSTARIYPMYGERMALAFPESNLSGVESITIGADAPSPVEKSKHWVDFMTQKIRAFGLDLMFGQGERFDIQIGSELTTTDPFPCLCPGCYSVASSLYGNHLYTY